MKKINKRNGRILSLGGGGGGQLIGLPQVQKTFVRALNLRLHSSLGETINK
jgi:hypothetical protein